MNRLEKAIMFATIKHDGQVDKIGEPYILHPIRVMLSLNTEQERIVAILHDVIEDTDASAADIVALGMPVDIVSAICCITKEKGQPYEDYIEKVKSNALALTVKKADISDNMSPIRLFKLDPSKREYLKAKYEKALEMLKE